MLFPAHLIATAANAGKVAVTRNPLAVNWSQWLAFVRSAVPPLKWALFDKEEERHRFVAARGDDWGELHARLGETWRRTFLEPVRLD